MRWLDLNCDLGEGAGHDAALMPLITSANIACGAHAGDEAAMRTTLALARMHGVASGAHPGFADRASFGRRELPLAPEDITALVLGQVRTLQRLAQAEGIRLGHVKPHGGLYTLSARDPGVAAAVARAVREADPRLVVFGLPGSVALSAARECGLAVAAEFFCDRTYQPDGSLTPRDRPGACVPDAEAAMAQVLRLVREGRVRATDGTDVTVAADTVCLHGDGPQAVAFARRLREALAAAGIAVGPLGAGR